MPGPYVLSVDRKRGDVGKAAEEGKEIEKRNRRVIHKVAC